MDEISNKEKCFKYFSENDDKGKDKLIEDAAKKFKIAKVSAQTYYYNWKKEYMDGAIQGVNHRPKDSVKTKKDEPGVKKEQESLTANKFKLEEHTAKFRIKKLLKQRELMEMEPKEGTEMPEVKDDEKLTEEEIEELCENTEYEKPKPKKLLKIVLLQGKVMNYEIQEDGFLLRNGSSSNAIPVGKKDIDNFIAELQELKEVIV